MNVIRSIRYMTNKKNWRKTSYVEAKGAFNTNLFYEYNS